MTGIQSPRISLMVVQLRQVATILCILMAAGINSNAWSRAIQVTNLKVEHLTDPLGIQTPFPRLRWVIESTDRGALQSAYQVLVATSIENLDRDLGDKWDSGKVSSDNSVEVLYRGKTLVSEERAYWKVRIWDSAGRVSAYSSSSFFEMGLQSPSDWKGKWIAGKEGVSSPLLRRELSIDAPIKRARIYVCGLGWYELSINGQKIGDRVLDPASTTYRVAPGLQQKSRVLYATYDVSDALKAGHNAIGVMLGRGWYTSEMPTADVVLRRANYGNRPILMLQLNVELMNGKRLSLSSDETWKTAPGPITYNDIANGEVYDARRECPGWNLPGFGDHWWQTAELARQPNGILTSQLMPPAEVMQTIPVTRIIDPREPELFENARIYDFGQSFSGWARLTVSGPRGAKVRLHFFSRIDPFDDTPDDRSNNSAVWEARQTDTYILKGAERELWEPRFTLHGFRYVEVRTSGDDVSVSKLEGRFVRSAVESTGAFVGSNDLLNKIQHNIKWTLMTSFQGIPQDAFERGERVAYLGDVGFVAEDYLYNFDMVGFWEKWLDDIQDTQNSAGSIPIVAPAHMGVFPTDPLWPSFQSAYPMLLWSLYKYYGDKVVLERHYDSLKKLLNFMNASAQDDLIAAEPLGDHMEPQPDGFSSFAARHTPQELTANAYYYYCVITTARIAEVLDRSEDAKAEGVRAQRILAAFNRRFFNASTNEYGSGSQTSNALPLYLDMVPSDKVPKVMKNLIDDIVTRQGTHVSTGIVGSNALAQALPRFGGGEVMYSLANQTTYPSLGEQVVKGATAVCESYECGPWLSQNMKMFTSLDKFFYRNLGGIEVTSPGYRRVFIKPLPLGDLRSVEVSQRTVRGDIIVEWKRDVAKFDLDVTIPAGAEAAIAIPNLGIHDPQVMEGTQTIWHGGMYHAGVAGLTGAVAEPDSIVFHAGSGSYHFTLRGPADSGVNANRFQ